MSEHEDSTPLLPVETLKRIEQQSYPIVMQGIRVVVTPPRHVFYRKAFASKCDVGWDIPGGGAA